MPKYSIYAEAIVSKYLGEVEADSLDEAFLKVDEDEAIQEKSYMSLCNYCASEAGDLSDTEIRIVKD